MIRMVCREDSAQLLCLEREVTAAGQGVVRCLDEIPTDVEEFAEQLESWLSGEDKPPMGLRLIAELADGRLAAEGCLSRLGPSMVRHTAVAAVQVHPDHQGRGLGRAVLEALVDWARRDADPPDRILRIELYVRDDNHRAIELYESLGFQTEGVRRALVRDEHGVFHDDRVMALLLGPAKESSV